MSLQLRIQDLTVPPDDAPHGDHLVKVLRSSLQRGSAPPVGVVVRERVVHLIDVREAVKAQTPVGRLLAGLTRARFDESMDRPLAVGVMGAFELRQPGQSVGVPLVQVFLEWPDCAWWHWRALLDTDGGIREDTETVQGAAFGDRLPPRLGRWWSTGRRHSFSLHLRRQAPPPQEPALVH